MLNATKITLKTFAVLLLAVIVLCGLAAPVPASQKMTADEVIAKHLASIGTPEAIAAAKTRIAVGKARAFNRTKVSRDITGVAQFASDGDKVLFAMLFDILDYPYEKAGYDGDKMTVSLLERSVNRSTLGNFLMSHDSIFKQGLIGGALSSAWPFINSSGKKPKLSYDGKSKINGREAYKLKYSPPRGSGDFQINLFFDAETFHHIRTEYQYTIPNQMGARPSEFGTTNTGSRTLNRQKMVEEFSDFKTTGGLTLPHTYSLKLTVDADASGVLEWVVNYSQFIFNQPIDASAFNVAATK